MAAMRGQATGENALIEAILETVNVDKSAGYKALNKAFAQVKSIDLKAAALDGSTPLQLAVKCGNAIAVEWLFDPNQRRKLFGSSGDPLLKHRTLENPRALEMAINYADNGEEDKKSESNSLRKIINILFEKTVANGRYYSGLYLYEDFPISIALEKHNYYFVTLCLSDPWVLGNFINQQIHDIYSPPYYLYMILSHAISQRVNQLLIVVPYIYRQSCKAPFLQNAVEVKNLDAFEALLPFHESQEVERAFHTLLDSNKLKHEEKIELLKNMIQILIKDLVHGRRLKPIVMHDRDLLIRIATLKDAETIELFIRINNYPVSEIIDHAIQTADIELFKMLIPHCSDFSYSSANILPECNPDTAQRMKNILRLLEYIKAYQTTPLREQMLAQAKEFLPTMNAQDAEDFLKIFVNFVLAKHLSPQQTTAVPEVKAIAADAPDVSVVANHEERQDILAAFGEEGMVYAGAAPAPALELSPEANAPIDPIDADANEDLQQALQKSIQAEGMHEAKLLFFQVLVQAPLRCVMKKNYLLWMLLQFHPE